MAEIVKPESPEPGMFDCWQKVPLDQVVGVKDRAFGRREDEFVHDAAITGSECAQHSAITKLKKHAPKLSRKVHASGLLTLGSCELPGHIVALNEDVMVRIADAENVKVLLGQTERLLAAQAETEKKQIDKTSLHDQVKSKLQEIGRLREYLSETECKINGERLDVAWRRVAASVPQKVFEVQVSGNLYSALGKLKKAHLLWNSQPFLVLRRGEQPKADDLLGGAFHEIRKSVVVRDLESVDELYTRVKSADESRQRFGL